MSTAAIYELIGYAGSILIVVSLAMSSLIRLRIINLVGAATFALYGVLIGSLPVTVTNLVIVGLDIWYLRKELNAREELNVLRVELSDPYVQEFLRYYATDIEKLQPEFDVDAGADVVFLMLRDVAPAGLFIGRRVEPGVLAVALDYVAPPFRDHRCGACLYGESGDRFTALGWNTITITDFHDHQIHYLHDMQFVDVGDGSMARSFASEQ